MTLYGYEPFPFIFFTEIMLQTCILYEHTVCMYIVQWVIFDQPIPSSLLLCAHSIPCTCPFALATHCLCDYDKLLCEEEACGKNIVNSVVSVLNMPSNMYIKKYYPTTAPIAKPSLRKRNCCLSKMVGFLITRIVIRYCGY